MAMIGKNTKRYDRENDSHVGCSSGAEKMALLEEVRIMGKQLSAEDVMGFSDILASGRTYPKKWPRQRFWMFRLGLYIFDFLAVYGSFLLAQGVAGMPFSGGADWMSGLWPMLFVILILPFFPSGDLYSYHLIFSYKRHLAAIFSALGWGGLAITMVLAQYLVPHLWQSDPLGTLLIGCACLGVLVWFVRSSKEAMNNLLRAAGISLIAVGLIHQDPITLLPSKLWYVVVGMVSAAIALSLGRYVIIEKVYHGWLMRHFRRQVGIVGTNKEAEYIASYIIENNAPFWVSGTIGCTSHLNVPIPKDCLGDIIDIPAIAKKNRLSDIIVTDEQLDRRTLISLLDFAMSKGITVWFPPSMLPIIDEKIYIDHFCGIPMIRMRQQKSVVFYNRFKYALDALMALPLMMLLLPLFGFIAGAIKINSPGPVFYKADAIGRNGEPFKMLKFRSMRVNNDNHIHKQYVTKLIKGEIRKEKDKSKPLKITNDPRITAVGNLLRKSSLDELPQLINVIMGQMSLIGPRPCLPYEFDVYQDWYKKRAAIRPGITGLWQVTGRSEVDFEEMILLDLYYVYNRNLWMDINILIETVFVILKKKGAH
jgi:undecaprenyl-phosphate galactose phosphotransferase